MMRLAPPAEPRAPIARFEIVPSGNSLDILLTAPSVAMNREAVATVKSTTPAEVRRELDESLDKFKRLVPGLLDVTDPASLSKPLSELRTVGMRVFYDAVGGTKNVVKLCSLFERIWPAWRNPASPAPLVEISSSIENTIPIELLPIFGGPSSRAVTDYLSLEDNLRAFLGFSVIVQRHITGENYSGATERNGRNGMAPGPSTTLHNANGLVLEFFQDVSLPAARKEALALRDLELRLTGTGPWPADSDVASLEDFKGRLFLARVPSDTDVAKDRAHILHFACHCNTRSGPNSFSISLWGGHGSKLIIRLDHLKEGAVDYYTSASRGGLARPLIVMNACGSSVVDPATAGSLPRFFIENEYLGFVGTETRVPDSLAEKFSSYFYQYFINGKPLSEALLRAKWEMVQRFNNPLGILYSAYANSDIRLEWYASKE